MRILQVSLFEMLVTQIVEPIVPPCEDWSTMEKLAKEKEVAGFTSRDIR
jgi:DNA polymerase-3 subunit alpha